MASRIDTIFANLAARPATHDSDVTIPVFTYAKLPEGDLPGTQAARVIRYISVDANADSAFLGLGPGMTILWTVSDVLYFKQAADGGQYYESEPHLLEYAKSYLNEMYQDAGIDQQTEIETISVTPGVVFWPDDGSEGHAYYGVTCLLEMREHLVGLQST